MLAWKLKRALSGDRRDFQINMGPLRIAAAYNAQTRALYYPQSNRRHVGLGTGVRPLRWSMGLPSYNGASTYPSIAAAYNAQTRALYYPQPKSRHAGLETEARP